MLRPTGSPLTLALSCALACALPTRAQELPARDGPLVVVLDPGHGGPHHRDGAHGRGGLVEKEIALQVAVRLKARLEQAGATVLLTREDDTDVPLSARAQLANENAADLFLSIHCNSMPTRIARKRARGVETYFLSLEPTDAEARLLAELENGGPDAVPLPAPNDPVTGILADLALGQARNDGAALAQIIHRHLTRATGAHSRGVRQAPFVVLAGARMPAVLVEIGFISHPQEGRLLGKDGYQERIAAALAAGVREFGVQVLSRRLLAADAPTPVARAPRAPSSGRAGARPASRSPAPDLGVAAASLAASGPARAAAPAAPQSGAAAAPPVAAGAPTR
ncbi:MAG TPA: N-acetylmuramoyl-L-alanine amidase [Myxococcales bacterium]|nr:N-acetylmuramoyl-L-alanine amidase [Myxococcales bacterium]